jgi:hypothetical protein
MDTWFAMAAYAIDCTLNLPLAEYSGKYDQVELFLACKV